MRSFFLLCCNDCILQRHHRHNFSRRFIMFGLKGIPLYILIFLGQVLQVMISTLRVIFMNKDRKALVLFLTFFEYGLYVIIFSTVLTDMYADPFKIVVYIVATAFGIYGGMIVENRMAYGYTSVQVIAREELTGKLGRALKDKGFGVTIVEGRSVDGDRRSILFVQLKRRRVPEIIRLIRETDPTAVVSQSEVQSISGGYVR
jgi:uncharacterized protein YebE (UPF0316 family)